MGADDASLFSDARLWRNASRERYRDRRGGRSAASGPAANLRAGRAGIFLDRLLHRRQRRLRLEQRFGHAARRASGPDPFTAKGNGFVGGAQAGYNWQVGARGLRRRSRLPRHNRKRAAQRDAGPTISATDKTPWFGTVRGRLGYAIDRILLYATGGAVYGDGSLNGTVSLGAGHSPTPRPSGRGRRAPEPRWRSGAAGAQSLNISISAPRSTTPAIPTVTAVGGSASTNIVRAGINYHF